MKFIKDDEMKEFTKRLSNKLNQDTNLYIVGGYVRDSLLNLNPDDLDLMIDNSTDEEVLTVLNNMKSLGEINDVDKFGKSFSVFKVKLPTSKEVVDIALARTEVSTGEGHKDFDICSERISAEEDAKRRDFTINAIFVKLDTDPEGTLRETLVDYVDGLKDLENKCIKAVGDPKDRFLEDPLRILRCFRFAIQKNFSIESNTVKTARKLLGKLKTISEDRIFKEIEKSMEASIERSQKLFLKKGSNKKSVYKECLGKDLCPYFKTKIKTDLEIEDPKRYALTILFNYMEHVAKWDKVSLGKLYIKAKYSKIPHMAKSVHILKQVGDLINIQHHVLPFVVVDKIMQDPVYDTIKKVYEKSRYANELPVFRKIENPITLQEIKSWEILKEHSDIGLVIKRAREYQLMRFDRYTIKSLLKFFV